MIKDITTYPTPPSVNYSTDVRIFSAEMQELVDDMKDTINANDLDGLTAFQIGSMYNIVLIKKEDGSFLELINPRVIFNSGKVTTVEKTAYFPGLSAKVTRHEKISVVYEDRALKQHSLKADGDLAILIQRKIDYTFGSSFINKLDKDEKKRFELKLEFGSDVAISESCPTTFNRDKILKVINYSMFGMVLYLVYSFFVSDKSALEEIWQNQLYISLGVLFLNIVYFFYAQYEGKKYTSCTSCQIGNIIGTTVISLAKLSLIMVLSFLII